MPIALVRWLMRQMEAQEKAIFIDFDVDIPNDLS